MIKGIDVSHHNGNIDFEKARKDGVEFVIIRAGYGNSEKQIDKKFHTNYEKAKKAGLKVGAYWYSYALNKNDALDEAEAFKKVIKGKKFEFPIYFDIEEQKQYLLSKYTKDSIITTFCNTLEKAGYFVGIYSYDYFLSSLYKDTKDRYTIWVANTTKNPCVNNGVIRQYSHKGKIDGISSYVDLNTSKSDFSVIIKKHFNNN